MRNYGEALVYWYLRLNGFFPITDFVLHGEPAGEGSSDWDVVAIRSPHVYEKVGGSDVEWDNDFLGKIDPTFQSTIGILVEVKTGKRGLQEVSASFRKPRLIQGLERMGLVPRDEVPGLVQRFANSRTVSSGRFVFAKLAVVRRRPTLRSGRRYFVMSLDQITSFIEKRMNDHKGPKTADRMFFSDPLIQYFAAKAGVDQETDG